MTRVRRGASARFGRDAGDDAASSSRQRRPARVAVNESSLANAALAYLNRVPASRAALIEKLSSWVKKRGEPADPALARPLILALVERYQSSGLIDDRKLAENAVASFRARGLSGRAIEYRLRARGIPEATIAEALAAERRESSRPERDAANAFVRRRRIGPLRPEAERAPNRRRDLAALARAGFDFDTAKAALAVESDDEF